MDNVFIRKAISGDEQVLACIQTESWKAAFAGILSPEELVRCTDLQKAEQMYHGVLRREGCNMAIELVNDQPHCIAAWGTNRCDLGDTVGELICIHSLQNNWAKGYGSAMMEYVLAQLQQANYESVILWVFEANTRARKFYEKHGFERTEQKKMANGIAELMYMKKFDRRYNSMLLKTERLTIRHIVADDWKSIRDIWADFNSSEYAQYDTPHITENANVQARIAKWAAANSGTEHMFFAICLDETVIGYIAFNIRENGYEIGYCFHSAYHGKGYAKESMLALFDYLRTLGITNFSAGTAINNTPSVKLLTSLGFKLVEQEKVSFYKDAMGNDVVFDGGIFELEYPNLNL